MAEVTITKDGKRGRIDEAKLSAALARGWSRADAPTTPAAPAEQPSFGERALKKFTDFNEGAAQGFLKQASMGLDDEVARLSARLGGTIQRQSDADDAMLSGGGESILESWRATQGLGQEAADERRQEVERAAAKAPGAYGAGSLAGLGTAVAGGPGAAKTMAGRLGQGAAFGGVGGAGMSDADTLAEAAPDAALGAGLGGLLGAAGPAVGRFAKGVKDTLAPGLRKAVGDVPGGMRAAGDRLEDLVTSTASNSPWIQGMTAPVRAPVSALGKTLKAAAGPAPVPEATAGLAPVVDDEVAAQMLARLKGSPAAAPKAAPEATASLPPQMEKEGFAEILARLKGEGVPAAPKAPAPAAPLPSSAPPVPPPQAAPAKPPVSFLPAVDDVSTVGPAQIRAANESMTPMNVRRSVLGRRPTNDEMDAAVAAAAQEVGPDVASIVSKTGLPTREVSERLTRRLREADFRQRLPDAEGRVARETAQSPVDNVSGRASKQVQAIGQQEGWSRAYQALPPEKRAAYIQQLKQETGLPDDVIRRRLKLTMAEWRRTSFERGGATKKKVIDEPRSKKTAP
jgi:hypothetical protein